MKKKEIKKYIELNKQFNVKCEKIKKIIETLPSSSLPNYKGDIFYADYFYIISDTNLVGWHGNDRYRGYLSGHFPIEYLSLTDEELKAIVDKKQRELREEQLAKDAEVEKKKKEERKKLFEELKKEFES